jgi:hypothetical protein
MEHHVILRLLSVRHLTTTSICKWAGRRGPTKRSPNDLFLWGWAKGEIYWSKPKGKAEVENTFHTLLPLFPMLGRPEGKGPLWRRNDRWRDTRIKRVWKKQDGRKSSGFLWFRIGKFAGSFKHSIKALGPIKCEEFIDCQSDSLERLLVPQHRFSVWGRFFAPFQTGRGAHPAFHNNGYPVFPGGKAVGTWRWLPTTI